MEGPTKRRVAEDLKVRAEFEERALHDPLIRAALETERTVASGAPWETVLEALAIRQSMRVAALEEELGYLERQSRPPAQVISRVAKEDLEDGIKAPVVRNAALFGRDAEGRPIDPNRGAGWEVLLYAVLIGTLATAAVVVFG